MANPFAYVYNSVQPLQAERMSQLRGAMQSDHNGERIALRDRIMDIVKDNDAAGRLLWAVYCQLESVKAGYHEGNPSILRVTPQPDDPEGRELVKVVNPVLNKQVGAFVTPFKYGMYFLHPCGGHPRSDVPDSSPWAAVYSMASKDLRDAGERWADRRVAAICAAFCAAVAQPGQERVCSIPAEADDEGLMETINAQMRTYGILYEVDFRWLGPHVGYVERPAVLEFTLQ